MRAARAPSSRKKLSHLHLPTVFIENFPLWEHGRFSSGSGVRFGDGKQGQKKISWEGKALLSYA